MSNFAEDYVDVAQRIRDFREKFPTGSLRPADITKPFDVVLVAGKAYIAYMAAAYRTPDDPCPGIGQAWEVVPGPTPFTRDSELQNAETSAWGRAIVAALAADTKRIASSEDVERAQARDALPPLESTLASPQRIHQLTEAVKAVDAGEWVAAQKFPWPWSVDACDAIKTHLDGLPIAETEQPQVSASLPVSASDGGEGPALSPPGVAAPPTDSAVEIDVVSGQMSADPVATGSEAEGVEASGEVVEPSAPPTLLEKAQALADRAAAKKAKTTPYRSDVDA